MASGFMSSVVHRLFHGKDKDRSPRPDSAAARPQTHHRQDRPSSSLHPSSTSSVAPAAAAESVPKKQKRVKSKNQENRPTLEVAGNKADHTKRKPALLSSLRRKTRPLSCIAARPDSPTDLQANPHPQSPALPSKASKQQGKSSKKKAEMQMSASQQRKEKKPRRPLSCIVQPPSPRLLPSVDNSPQLLHRSVDVEASPSQREGSSGAARTQPKPRPVSCFVETPVDRSPPPYFRRAQGSSAKDSQPVGQYTPFQVGSPQRSPPSYLEASRRPPKLSSPTLQTASLDEGSPRQSPPYRQESSQQCVPKFTANTPLPYDYPNNTPLPYNYPKNTPMPYNYSTTTPLPSNYGNNMPYDSEHLQDRSPCSDNRQQFLPPPVQSVGQSRPPQGSGRCGDVNCFLDPCPYRPPIQSPPYGSSSYDLKAYFPSASPAPRYARPQSACFLCESQPCRLEAPKPCRPRSQCFVPDCNLSWCGPDPNLNWEQPMQQASLQRSPEGDHLPREEESVPRPQRQPSSPTVAMETSSPAVPSPDNGRPPPRPAKRTLGPRPKSTCLLPTESDSSPVSSPAPSPRPRRFPLKKYRSADCLDRVDEVESLEVSPPPAKPLSYFTDTDNPQQMDRSTKQDEIFTSAEMLEKVGQPRSRRQQPRPVSCFVGSSADESGYLSNATLGGSGWLGGLSVSTGDILELLDGDELDAADDELSFERASSFRKAWSVCSLLRQDSIQDRSFTVMRRRRQRMKDRRHTNQRSSSTETDDGVEVKGENSTSSLTGEVQVKNGESAGFPLDRKLHVPGSRGAVMRLHSAHMKAWQIRLRRKQMMKKRRSTERLGSRVETLV